VTDQSKGSIAAVKEVLPDAFHFHCSWHRRQNITKYFGSKEGSIQLSANWMFNQLSNCSTLPSIQAKSALYFPQMNANESAYLQVHKDNEQYPAARCAMQGNICMYSRTASSGVESMNRANMEAREATAVDMLNSVMVLLRLESGRFEAYKRAAWNTHTPPTPQGMDAMRLAFENVNTTQFTVTVSSLEECYQCTVRFNKVGALTYTVKIPKVPTLGSMFGTCTCGIPKRDGLPCIHMVVLAKGGNINHVSFTRVSVMPYWLTSEYWRQQYPMESVCRGDIELQTVMNKYNAEDDIRYCPSWAAPNKAGRPKKNQHGLSVADHISSAAKKRKKRMFCKRCQKFNHNYADCFQNPKNQRNDHNEPAEEMNVDDDNEPAEEMNVDDEGVADGAQGAV